MMFCYKTSSHISTRLILNWLLFVFFRVPLVTVVFLVLVDLKVLLEIPDAQESLASPEPE